MRGSNAGNCIFESSISRALIIVALSVFLGGCGSGSGGGGGASSSVSGGGGTGTIVLNLPSSPARSVHPARTIPPLTTQFRIQILDPDSKAVLALQTVPLTTPCVTFTVRVGLVIVDVQALDSNGTALKEATTEVVVTQGTSTTAAVLSFPDLQSISITPTKVALPQGTTQQLTATGAFSDGTTQDLTKLATWT
jgi:hypothetical protein